MQFAVSVHRAAEDYLEAMLMMKEQHGYVRSIDVAEHLGVTKPSVTYATKQLKQNGFITMDRDGLITLTESGMEIADRIYTPAQDADGVFHPHRRRRKDRAGGRLQGRA